jgi:hypothetical protein
MHLTIADDILIFEIKTQIENTLYGVSIINLPSGDTQGRLSCWKKVTCKIEE